MNYNGLGIGVMGELCASCMLLCAVVLCSCDGASACHSAC